MTYLATDRATSRADPAVVFDAYARDYDDVLNDAIAVSGERKEFFARGRVALLARRLTTRGATARSVLDYGCGTGATAELFVEMLGATTVIGVDVSTASLEIASSRSRSFCARFLPVEQHSPAGDIDLAFCNGVFHHIAPHERMEALRHVHRSLSPGGWFAFWENNPWNPGAVYCMWRNPFDRDARMISPRRARRLLALAGFRVVETNYAFFFPRRLRALRRFEPSLHRVPFGAQYLVLARKPAAVHAAAPRAPHVMRRARSDAAWRAAKQTG